jgi:hypothetical protein
VFNLTKGLLGKTRQIALKTLIFCSNTRRLSISRASSCFQSGLDTVLVRRPLTHRVFRGSLNNVSHNLCQGIGRPPNRLLAPARDHRFCRVSGCPRKSHQFGRDWLLRPIFDTVSRLQGRERQPAHVPARNDPYDRGFFHYAHRAGPPGR